MSQFVRVGRRLYNLDQALYIDEATKRAHWADGASVQLDAAEVRKAGVKRKQRWSNAGIGLCRKFATTRVDGRPEPSGSRYFTLNVGRDGYAQLAALKYAQVVRRSNPELAIDLENLVEACRGRHPETRKFHI